MKHYKKHIEKVANDNEVSEEIAEAVVRSIYEYIRYNSKEMLSVRIPNFGLFVVKPNRVKHINERKRKGKAQKHDNGDSEWEGN